jgi:glycosyltransferase involved in cell wall biosynthesis
MNYPRINLVLFFTRHIALYNWYSIGSLSREVALYRKLRDYNVQTTFITYGGRRDLKIAREHLEFPVKSNFLHFPPKRYERWLHLLHAPTLWSADMIKTNQTNGSDIALRAALFWKKPMIARFGYMHSFTMIEMHGKDSRQAQDALQLESQVFSRVNAVIGTSELLTDDIKQRFPATPVFTLPNFVDTDVFAPQEVEKTVDITYIGRLAPEKNVPLLLDAIANTPFTCRLIGGGVDREAIQAKYGDMDGRVQYIGQVAHDELPRYLNETRIFVMPSLFEGHPKAIIEAMSCGVPIVATNVQGTREVIQHGKTGWLTELNPDDMRDGLSTLLDDANMRHEIGAQAREYALEHYQLDVLARREYEIIRQVVGS